ANLTASRMSFKSMRKFRLFQSDAYLAVDFENRELTYASKKAGATGPIPGVGLQTRRFNPEDVLNKEIIAFVKSIKTGQEPPISGEAGRAALSLALEIMAAMKIAKG
ncbi:MAG: gfo/Idh/MocA family oxidoreductase, partial [Deltaproteobacteria bacterium]|nr:gfo/Idh/MocA family oxidoreductase [Deltaproteobacteria bacterium]